MPQPTTLPRAPKYINIKILKATTLPAVLYGCEIQSLVLKKENKLKMSEKWVLRRISERKFAAQEDGENCMRIFTAFALHHISY
jgi:hypothetical protein